MTATNDQLNPPSDDPDHTTDPDPHDHDGDAATDIHQVEPDAGYVIIDGGSPFRFDDPLVVERAGTPMTMTSPSDWADDVLDWAAVDRPLPTCSVCQSLSERTSRPVTSVRPPRHLVGATGRNGLGMPSAFAICSNPCSPLHRSSFVSTPRSDTFDHFGLS